MKATVFLSIALAWVATAFAQVPVSGLPPVTTPLSGAELVPVVQAGQTRKATVANFNSLAPPLAAAYILQSASPTIPNSRVLSGTVNQVILSDGGPLGNLTLSLPQSIATTSNVTFGSLLLGTPLTVPNGGTGTTNLTGLILGNGITAMTPYAGTACTNQFIRSLNLNGVATCNSVGPSDFSGILLAVNGGTGFGAYAVGDLLSADTTSTLSRVADVAVGSYLRSGGVSTLPLWSTLKLPNAATTGDLLLATATNSVASLADVATGSYLRSGGVGAVPTYSTTTVPNTVTTGDIWMATGTNVTGILADVAVGSYLRSSGVGLSPGYSATTLPSSSTLGDIWYGSATNVISALAGNTVAAKRFLTQTGTGTVSAAPGWNAIVAGDLPGSFSGFANPTALSGPTVVNGSATTAMRSDGAPAVNQTASYSWTTGTHMFSGPSSTSVATTGMSLGANASTGEIEWTTSGAAADQKVWDCFGDTTGQFNCRAINDAHSGASSWILVNRTLATVTSVQFPGTGTTATAANAVLDGTNTLLKSTSSRRYKQDIAPLDRGVMNRVLDLVPVRYHSRALADDRTMWWYGLIAEDVAEVEPRLVAYDKDGRPDGVQYDRVGVLLLGVVKQQQTQIRVLWAALLAVAILACLTASAVRRPMGWRWQS